MKKTAILFLFMACVVSATSQLKKITPTPLPPSSVNAAMPRQQTDLRKQVGKDLKIALTSVDKSTSNFAIGLAGIYTVNFEVINSGAEDINITGIGIQAYLKNASGGFVEPAGGYSLLPALPNFPANGILHPGDKFRSTYLRTGLNPADYNGKNLTIILDNSNTIAETNETNNTLEIPVIGNLESWSTPLPDLTFQIDQIAPVTGSTFLNTAIHVSVINTGNGEIPLDVARQIIPSVQVYPAGNPGTNLYNEAYPFATRVNGTQVYPGYYKASGALKPGDKVSIGGSVHINGLSSGATVIFHFTLGTLNNTPLPETNTANNTVDYVYTVQ
ncbi:MAG: hypothetical protein JST86_01795 [Bacteroidetes bacterium]|nr:hypothetical protein [Bacteroidota bacterium]